MNGVLTLAFISREALLLIVSLPVAIGVGFAFGVLYERWYQASALQRIGKRFEKLFAHATGVLDRAEKVCTLLNERMTGQSISPAQQSRLQLITSRLLTQLTCLTGQAAREDAITASPSAIQRPAGKYRPPVWQRESRDERTGLPDAIAFQSNFQQLLKTLDGADVSCGMLYVQVDQYPNLVRRTGTPVADQFVQTTASLILRQLRDTDLLCQITEDVLVAILPEIGREEMERVSHAARKSLRNHEFLNSETGQPVFVTASFGYAVFDREILKSPAPAEELWQKGQLALQASQKRGRCQLHEITASGTSRLVAG